MDALDDVDLELLLHTFLGEAEEQLGEMEQGLVALEDNSGDNEALEATFRAAHTLKGNAASMGFASVAELAHGLEDVLETLREQAAAPADGVVTLLLNTVDAIRQVVKGKTDAGGEGGEIEVARLLKDLATAAGVRLSLAQGPTPIVAASQQSGPDAGRDSHTLRVDLERLNRMLNLSGEIAVARGRFLRVLEQQGGEVAGGLLQAHRDADRIFMDLQEEILRARMVPLGPTFRQQARTLRDAARASGKLARLEIQGEDVEVDATLVEGIRGPITHMIRNALDHGIEAPAVRSAAGKDPRGRVALHARHDSGAVVIEVSDDGAGLDRERIARTAMERGLVETGRSLSDAELLDLIFSPGFSTADSVSELSGRGIGMDVVRRNVEAIRGTVGVRTEPGAGTTFVIRVPLTVAIIQGFLVGVGDETHVVPLETVLECVDLQDAAEERRAATGVFDLRGEAVPYLRLREALGLPRSGSHTRESLVVVAHEGRRAALAVDALLGESQLVVKPFGRLLQGLPGVAGSTILGSGRVALILDVASLIRRAIAHASTGPRDRSDS
jgi:two-component system, chemotaxis family, sensor kinase CheA